mgnify:CR=1 FL=1
MANLVTKFAVANHGDIQSYIDNQRENIKKVNAENTVFKSVVDSTSVEVPQSMVDREVASLKSEYQQRLAYQGVNWEEFLKSQGEAFEKSLTEEAEMRIKNSLIVERIAQEADLKIEQKDIMEHINQLAAMYGMPAVQLFEEMRKNPNSFAAISQQITANKVNEYLTSRGLDSSVHLVDGKLSTNAIVIIPAPGIPAQVLDATIANKQI